MKKWGLVFFLLIYFPFAYKTLAQNVSNEGTDFWAVFPSHDPSVTREGIKQLANVRIYITAKTGSRVVVSCGTFNQEKAIPANIAVPFDIPRDIAYIDSEKAEPNTVLQNRGIHVVVKDGSGKVSVYQHIYAGARSAASLILPREALGQKYYSMNYTQDLPRNAQELVKNLLTLVATDPNTSLLIHRTDGTTVPVHFNNAGDVYEYMAPGNEDLTGTFVEIDPTSADNCNKRFAAFSGSTAVSIVCNSSKDPLFQQLYPTISWGKNYGVVPFIDRGYKIRILAQEQNTQVKINGNTITLNNGQYYENPGVLTEPVFISADKKISVAQYSLTQDCSAAVPGNRLLGDPEMVLLNPIEFSIKAITLFSSTDEAIGERYINVLIKTTAAPSFKINGQTPVNGVWKVILNNPEYSYIQVKIRDINSTLTANDGFNAIAYGFGDHESYAYSAGTNLAANTYFLVSNRITQHDAQNACIGQESDFKLILPYQIEKITWKLDNDQAEEGSVVPNIITAADGTPSYEYVYLKDKVFTEIRQPKVTILVKIAGDDGSCLDGEAEFTYNFDVYPIPTPDFDFAPEGCADTDIQFNDKSNSNIVGRPLNKWLWDFGDNKTSTEQHPKHSYASSGPFTVKLSVGLDEGCMSDVWFKTIIIRPKITAKFEAPEIGCIKKKVFFTNQSTVESGTTIVKWYWDFGENTIPPSDPTIADMSYIYDKAGTYTVSLVTETANGCKSLAFTKEITITDLPKPNFTLPKVCTSDIVQFQNTSVDVGGGNADLTYQWDFGDPVSGADNYSDKVIGSHQYTTAGKYFVKLTVTNKNGCSDHTIKELTVNGSDISPSFEVINKDNLCSREPVIFKNTSDVAPSGTVTKLVWYFDFENKPTEFITDENPAKGKEQAFTYPVAISAVPRIIKVKMVAYSGQECFKEVEQYIKLYPNPHIVFDDIQEICINARRIQLTQASETLGIPGKGVYTGKGIITPEGEFDPAVAGVGTWDITYAFTADGAGCADIQTRSITVNPLPSISIDKEVYILAGGEKKINVTAAGQGQTYKWSPSAGLSRDDIPDPVVTGDQDKQYLLTISSSKGCSITERILVYVLPTVKAANTFSPNADGVNDTWMLKYIDTYTKATVEIFNLHGEKIFYSVGYATPFDGNYRNQPLPVGTYYYIINPRNGRKNITGSLTLLR